MLLLLHLWHCCHPPVPVPPRRYGIGMVAGYLVVGTVKHLLGKLPGSLGEGLRKKLREWGES